MTTAELGAFCLEDVVGRGGMGTVWRGRHKGTQEVVAIKVITASWGGHEKFHDVFVGEVQAVARMHHPGIVRVFDHGYIDAAADKATLGVVKEGSPYLVMEYAAAGDLENLHEPVWVHVCEILIQVLEALTHAHARGLVHLDLKPGNVLLQRTGERGLRVKLSDFGLAFAYAQVRTQEHLHASGIVGTPSYMPPEQFMGRWRDYGPWSDLYALGCMAYEMVVGSLPFQGDNLLLLANAHLQELMPALAPRCQVPAGFEPWLRRMLAKDWRHRYETAADALFALRALSGRDAAYELTDRLLRQGEEGGAQTEMLERPNTWLSDAAIGELETLASTSDRVALATLARVDCDREGVAPRVPAPMSERWGRANSVGTQTLMRGVGLGLWGLRQLPVVGRVEERDALWSVLSQVHRGRGPKGVMVWAPSGQGKSRLVTWLLQRSQEVGAAHVLTATHARQPGPTDGLRAMFSMHFGLVGLDGAQAQERIEARLVALCPGRGEEELGWDALAWAAWLLGHQDGAKARRGERLSLVRRYLAMLSRVRPVLLCLEDVQYGPESLSLARELLEAPDVVESRVMIVLTGEEHAGDVGQHVQEGLRACRASSRCTELPLKPLTTKEHEHLISHLLGLSPEVAAQVQERTQGSPRFAVQLVHDWVTRGLLVPGDDGFVLAPGVSVEIPEDIAALCWERLGAMVSAVKGDEDKVWASLEIAATLGVRVHEEEWLALCARVGVPAFRDAWRQMVASGMAERVQDGWGFVSTMFAESLVERARVAGRLAGYHTLAAEMLGASGVLSDRVRRFHHLLGAQDWKGAAEQLTQSMEVVTSAQGEAMFEAFSPYLRKLDDRERAHYLLRARSPFALHQGNIQESRRLVDHLASVVVGDQELSSIWSWMDARTALYEQRYEHALAQAIQATETAVEARRGSVRRVVVQALTYLGRHDEALRQTELALADLLREQDAWNVCWTRYDLAMVLLEMERWEEATRQVDLALQLATQHGDQAAMVHGVDLLGQIQYGKGDFIQAAQYMRRAVMYAEGIRDPGVWLSRENLGRALLEANLYEEALVELERLDGLSQENKENFYVNPVDDALLVCWAGLGMWNAYDRRASEALALLEGDDVDYVFVEGFELLCDVLLRAGETMRAHHVGRRVMRGWEALGDETRKEALGERLRRYPVLTGQREP